MRIDIEGSECAAVRGLSGTLSDHRVDFVYFEVNAACLGLQQTDPACLFEEFIRHGYRLFWPHDSVDWILRAYGDIGLNRDARASPLRPCGLTFPGVWWTVSLNHGNAQHLDATSLCTEQAMWLELAGI